MDKGELKEILEKNRKYACGEKGGEIADLYGADLHGADLSDANLRQADLREANLCWADLHGADLSWANLRRADLRRANLRETDLSWADLCRAKLNEADLHGADLSWAHLRWTNLSGTKGLIVASTWMRENFQATASGVTVLKAIGVGTSYPVPDYWTIAEDEYLEEVVNPLRTLDCGCGVSFGTPAWIKIQYGQAVADGTVQIWECLIAWRDAFDVVVPYNTDGEARCGRLKLLRISR